MNPLLLLVAVLLLALIPVAGGAVVDANFTAATTVPVTAAGFTAAGNSVNLTLNFAPDTGTALTVVNNTGLAPIQGTFANLAQGQLVLLTYGTGTYSFVANHWGGSGNDLVLQWANARPVAWGLNSSWQVGDYSAVNRLIPTPVSLTGALKGPGKWVNAVSVGESHSLALCTDGTLAAWGGNARGQLGNNSTFNGMQPVSVNLTGVLAGRTVVAIAAGGSHSLVLCADGTLAAWGNNDNGQLGNHGTTGSSVPVLVDRTGVLADKTVVAIAAGRSHSLALCADGTVAAWGCNANGQVGNGGNADQLAPALVDTTGVLLGQRVVAIAAGGSHNLALCADGSLAAWGLNNFGQLGNQSLVDSWVPVLVERTGALPTNKTITAIAAGADHSFALVSGGILTAWGCNGNGQLGIGSSVPNSWAPAAAILSGVLKGKTITRIAACGATGNALCSDGTLTAWGFNANGQVGNNSTTDAKEPVLVSKNGYTGGGICVGLATGATAGHTLVVTALPVPSLSSMILKSGTLNPGFSSEVTSYTASTPIGATSITVTPTVFNYSGSTKVNGVNVSSGFPSAPIPLAAGPNVIAVVVIATDGAARTYTITVTPGPSVVSTLSWLALTPYRQLSPEFATATTAYTTNLQAGATTVVVTPTATDRTATIRVNGVILASGTSSAAIPVGPLPFVLAVAVTAPDGITVTTYTVTINNFAPSFSGCAVSTAYQTPVAVPLAKLLAKVTDADGDAFSIINAGRDYSSGAAVALKATAVSYTPPAGFSGVDTFVIVIRDARGAYTWGTVTVTVGQPSANGGIGANPPVLTLLPAGKMGIAFQGIPGRSYLIQRSAGGLDHWLTLATVAADAAGKVSFTDESPPPGSAFYRLGLP